MEKEEDKQAWSDHADAVYVSTVASIDELKGYSERMNLMLNLTRYVMSVEVADSIQKATGGSPHMTFVEVSILVDGIRHLVEGYIEELRDMPGRMLAIMHAEHGCGGCSKCKAAKKEAYGDGKVVIRPSSESQAAIEAIINTITSGKPLN